MDKKSLSKKTSQEPGSNDLTARIIVGILIFFCVAGFLIGLGWVFICDPLAAWGQRFDKKIVEQVNEATIMMLAAGVGSSIYTIRAYLKHACEQEDFKASYLPWYPYRLVIGALLGLMFYFALRGGILFLTVNSGDAQTIYTLNHWALAAVGALVGLFSRYALDKLRETFITIFGTKESDSENI